MRHVLSCCGRFLFYVSGALALYTALMVLGGCASVSPSREKPQVGCWFDEHRRFTYALIVERDSFTTTWVPRQLLTTARVEQDSEERIVTTRSVRAGYCPDEQKSMTGRHADVWRQEEDSDEP